MIPNYFTRDPWTGRPNKPSFIASMKQALDYLKKLSKELGLDPAFIKLKKWLNYSPKTPFKLKNIVFNALIHLILAWFVLGFVVIKPNTEGVVTRLRHYQRTIGPGLHWHMRFIETVRAVDIFHTQRHTETIVAFTQDGQLINATLELQYQIDNSRDFLFNCTQPIAQLRHTAISQLIAAIKPYTLSELVSTDTMNTIQKQLQYQLHQKMMQNSLGIKLMSVAIPQAHPPRETQKQFTTIENAQQEVKQLIQEAQKITNQLRFKTDKEIQQLYARANIRKHKMIMKAKADINQFLTLLPSYEENPTLTTQKLYFETIEKVLKKTPKAVVTQPNAMTTQHNTPIQMPLDQLFSKLTTETSSGQTTSGPRTFPNTAQTN